MVAQPQPPQHGTGPLTRRLRARRTDGDASGASGGGPAFLDDPPPPSRQPPPSLTHAHAAPDDDDDDLAPTLPRLPSLPRLATATATTPTTAALVALTTARKRVAADFAAFMCSRAYVHGPRLAPLTTDQRMRLFSLVGRVYLPALDADGRMLNADDDAG